MPIQPAHQYAIVLVSTCIFLAVAAVCGAAVVEVSLNMGVIHAWPVYVAEIAEKHPAVDDEDTDTATPKLHHIAFVM